MANQKNLINHKFKEGKSGNPNGRPKELPIIKQLIAEVLSDELKGMDAAKRILIAVRNKAVKGDLKAAELLMDRAYGRPRQQMDFEGTVQSFNVDLTKEDIKNIQKGWEEKY